MVRAEDVLGSLGKTGACRGPGFHSVGLVGLTGMEALSRVARLDCRATDARLQLIDLLVLLGGELVAEGASHGAAARPLVLVAVEGERVLSVDLAVHDFARLLKVVITDRQVTKDSAAAVITRLLLLSTEV